MGTEVISCPQCGMYYNATDYKECPYCSNGMVKPAKKQKKKPWWGRSTQQSTLAPVESSTPANSTPAVSAPQSAPAASTPPQRSPSASGHTVSLSAMLEQQSFAHTPQDSPDDTITAKDTPHLQAEVSPAPEPIPEPISEPPKKLGDRIDSIGKTTAKYISYANGEVTYPVVGWLVCVKGVYYGKSFPLKSGVNRIGRSSEFEVAMLLDNSVSHEVVVKILYDPKKSTFAALPGESALCYIDGNCIYEKTDLSGYEKIELGDSEKNCFVFVPFCGPSFTWSDYAPQE